MSETIVAVDRALDILLLLYKNGQEMGISEIGRELDLHKSTVHRTMATLESKGFVYQNRENGRYWLGIKLYGIGLLIGERLSLTDVIKPYAKKLFDEFQEVVNVSILDKGSVDGYKTIIILKEVDTSKVLSVNPNIGSISDSHASSVGKCLIAFSKDIDMDKVKKMHFKKHTENTIDNWQDFQRELDKVKETGYATDNEEQEIGLYCIGSPIFDKNGHAIAAISMSGPTARMKREDLSEKIRRVKEIASEISLAIK
ncbi:MAG: IclR family transcriptional regulator [Tissierellaceae bacterium]